MNKSHIGETAQESIFTYFQNDMIPWLSLILYWFIKTDNFCSANFLQKSKDDENWRRSQGGRKCLQCFTALRLRLVSISSVLAGFKEKNRWYRERGLHFPMHYGCTVMAWKTQIPKYLDVFYRTKSCPKMPLYLSFQLSIMKISTAYCILLSLVNLA